MFGAGVMVLQLERLLAHFVAYLKRIPFVYGLLSARIRALLEKLAVPCEVLMFLASKEL